MTTRRSYPRWAPPATAAAVATVLVSAIYALLPKGLPHHLDVVGWPTFTHFDFRPPIQAYRLLVWGWPAIFLTTLTILSRLGQLRDVSQPKAPSVPVGASKEDASNALSPTRWLRLLVPALLVTWGVSSVSRDPHAGLTRSGIGAGLLVLVGTLLVAQIVSRVAGTAFRDVLAGTNSVLSALTAVASVWLFAATAAARGPGNATQSWGYLPGWLALVTVVVLLTGLWFAGRNRDAIHLERGILTFVAGAAAVFILTSHLAPGVKVFVGFDDGQGLVGGDLLTQGWFPWRDFLFVHGLFDDSLRSAAGFALFGHTIWGAQTGTLAVWAPLCWVGLYLLTAWASRGRAGVLLVVAVPLLALAQAWQDETFSFVRWVGTPVVLLALAGALGERHPIRRSALMTLLLFVDAVLTPEASFLVLAVAIVLVASDLTRAEVGGSLLTRMRRTSAFVVTGVVLTSLWAGFLAWHGAVGAFADYFTVFVPDHNATGAVEVTPHRLGFPLFVVLVVTTLISLTVLGGRVLRRRSMSTRHWVLSAATVFAGLYGEKALGRFDHQHIYESFFGGLPMLVIAATMVLSAIDDRVSARLRAARATRSEVSWVDARPVSAMLALALTLVSLSLVVHAPSHNKVLLGSLHSDPRIGYDQQATQVRRTAADLASAIDALDPRGPVFDFSNSPGYVHFLVQRDPANRFTNIALALNVPAQELLLDELRASPPKVVVFDSGRLGASRWDLIGNDVRSYDVSQYLLDGWTPVRSVDGFVLMVRDDLVADGSVRTSPREVQALYASTPACNWGDSANYLASPPGGPRLVLPLRRVPANGNSRVSVARIPAGVHLADYAVADFQSGRMIGNARLTISDLSPKGDSRHEIRAEVLRFSGTHLRVRVGSCLQWHGYGGRLYVTQSGGAPVTRLVLSGVAQD